MQKDKLGCLIIHGFGGGIYEIKPLADYLTENGYIVTCTKLKGHTGCGLDMKNANYKDWITSAEEDLIELIKKTNNIVIVGFSMGGLIAINIACKYNIKGIVTINTPIYYWNILRVLINIIDDFKNKKFNNIKRYIKAKKASPIISMLNFLLLLKITKTKLTNIECPFLITQAKDDDTVRLKSVNHIYNNISSKEKEIKFYEKGGHLILISRTKDRIIIDIEIFLKKLIKKYDLSIDN